MSYSILILHFTPYLSSSLMPFLALISKVDINLDSNIILYLCTSKNIFIFKCLIFKEKVNLGFR